MNQRNSRQNLSKKYYAKKSSFYVKIKRELKYSEKKLIFEGENEKEIKVNSLLK